MKTRYRFQQFLQYDALDFLVNHAPSYVRYLTLKNILNEPEKSLEILFSKVNKKYADVFQGQDAEGYWKIPSSVKNEHRREALRFFTQTQQLLFLQDHGFTKEHAGVQRGIVALMKMQKTDGRFPMAYQHHGLALYTLLGFSLQGNPLLERGIRWIVKRQRWDGGWIHPTVLDDKIGDTSHAPSCIWTTLHIAMALIRHSRYRKLECTAKAVDFLLKNVLKPNYKNFFGEAEAWNHLHYGYEGISTFRGGTLKLLEALVNYGLNRNDKTIKKLSDWLREQQLKNGLFPAIAGLDKKGDPFVTYRSVKLFHSLFA